MKPSLAYRKKHGWRIPPEDEHRDIYGHGPAALSKPISSTKTMSQWWKEVIRMAEQKKVKKKKKGGKKEQY